MKKLKYYLACLLQFMTDIIMAVPFEIIRKLWLRIFRAKLGKNCFIGKRCDIRFPFRLSVGNNSVVNKYCILDMRGGGYI